MLFLFSVSGSKSHVFPLFAAHRPVFSKSLSRFSPPEFSPFPYSLMKVPFPRFYKFSSISVSPGFNLTPLFLFPPCRHFSCSPKLPFRPPFQTAPRPVFFRLCLPDPRPCPAHPFWFFPHLRFSFAFQPACPLSLRLYALFALVPYRPRRPRAPRVLFYAYGFVFPFLHGFPPFKPRLFLFFSGQPFRAVFSFAFRPRPWFSRRFVRFECTKKGRQLPAPIFIYIKNFPMYP